MSSTTVNFHIDKEDELHIEVHEFSGFYTLRINMGTGINSITIFADPQQLWDALKDLDLSVIEPKNMLEEQISEESYATIKGGPL